MPTHFEEWLAGKTPSKQGDFTDFSQVTPEQMSMFRSALGSVGRGTMTTLQYGIDFLSRPAYAMGNLWRALTTGNPEEAVDALRQFVPFAESMKSMLGIDVVPHVKKTLGMMTQDYLKKQGVNKYVAGITGFGVDVLNPLDWKMTKLMAQGTVKLAGGVADLAVVKPLKWMDAHPDALGIVSRTGQRAYTWADMAKGWLNSKFVVNKDVRDAGVLAQQVAQGDAELLNRPADFVLDQIVGGNLDMPYMHLTDMQVVSKSFNTITHAMGGSPNEIGSVLPMLSGRPEYIVPQAVADKITKGIQNLEVPPDTVVGFTHGSLMSGNAVGSQRFLDNFNTFLPTNVKSAGRLTRKIDQENGNMYLSGTLFGEDIAGKNVLVSAALIKDEQTIEQISKLLYDKYGANHVEVFTMGYNIKNGVEDVVKTWSKTGQAWRDAAKIIYNPNLVKSLREGAKYGDYDDLINKMWEAEDFTKARADVKQTLMAREGVKLGDVDGITDAVATIAKMRKRVMRHYAKEEGVSFSGDINYMPHQWTEDAAKNITLENWPKLYAEYLRQLQINNPQAYGKAYQRAQTMKNMEIQRNLTKMLERLGVKEGADPNFAEDVINNYARMIGQLAKKDPDTYKYLQDAGALPDVIEAQLIAHYGIHSSMTPRLAYHYNMSIPQLNDLYDRAYTNAFGNAPTFKIWEDNGQRLMGARTMKHIMYMANKGFHNAIGKYAKTTLKENEIALEYPDIVKAMETPIDVTTGLRPQVINVTQERVGSVLEPLRKAAAEVTRMAHETGDKALKGVSERLAAAQAAVMAGHDVKLGGRVMILRGGKYHGMYFFPDFAKNGKFPLFDPEIGRALAEKIRYEQVPGHAVAVASGLKGFFLNAVDWIGKESRAGMMYFTPRRFFRDTADDGMRAVSYFETPAVLSKWANEVAVRSEPTRSILGYDVELKWLQEQARPYGMYSGNWASMSAQGAPEQAAKWTINKPVSTFPLVRFFRDKLGALDNIKRDATLQFAIEKNLNKQGLAANLDNIKSVMKQSVDDVDKSLYIYSNITPFEKNVMAKYLVNFYPFIRKNTPFWFRTFYERPAHILAISRAFQYAGQDETQDEKTWRKPWLNKTLSAKIGVDQQGRPVYLTGSGLSIESMEQILAIGRNWKGRFQSWLSSMNPVFRIPLEKMSGRYFYFDNSIEEYTRAYEIMNQIPGLRDFLKIQEVRDANGNVKRWTADGDRLYYIQQISPFMQSIPLLDSIFNKAGIQKSKTSMQLGQALLGWMTGLNVSTGDPATYARILQRNAMTEALKEQHKAGLLGESTDYYMQKGVTLSEDEQNLYKAQIGYYHQLVRGR